MSSRKSRLANDGMQRACARATPRDEPLVVESSRMVGESTDWFGADTEIHCGLDVTMRVVRCLCPFERRKSAVLDERRAGTGC